MHAILVRTLAAAALSFSLGAQAAPVTRSFELAVDFASDVPGVSAGSVITGSFGFDDAEAPRAGVVQGELLYTLTSFTLSFAGVSYDEADLGLKDVVFSGTQFLGLSAAVADVFTLLPSVNGQAASFLFAPVNGRGIATATVSFGEAQQVPEPATAALLLAAAAAAAGLRRRRR